MRGKAVSANVKADEFVKAFVDNIKVCNYNAHQIFIVDETGIF